MNMPDFDSGDGLYLVEDGEVIPLHTSDGDDRILKLWEYMDEYGLR